MDLIARGSKLPFYHQLYEILHSKIVHGEWQPGDMIPTESELIEQYEVSRMTVRQALDILVNEGLIYRQQGRGTDKAGIGYRRDRLHVFHDDLADQ